MKKLNRNYFHCVLFYNRLQRNTQKKSLKWMFMFASERLNDNTGFHIILDTESAQIVETIIHKAIILQVLQI